MSSSLVWKVIHLGENNESETIITSPFPVHYSPLQLTRKTCCRVSSKLSHVFAFLDLLKENHRSILLQINFKYLMWEFAFGEWDFGIVFVSDPSVPTVLTCDCLGLMPRSTVPSSHLCRRYLGFLFWPFGRQRLLFLETRGLLRNRVDV